VELAAAALCRATLRGASLRYAAHHPATQGNDMLNPTKPEHAEIIKRLEDRLSAVSMGGAETYAELNKVAGRDVKKAYRWLLNKAIENVEKSMGCAFECIRDFGIQRLASSEAPEIGLASVRRCRAAAKRGKKRLDRLNSNSMSDNERRRVIGYSAMLGAVAMISDGRKATAIAAVADPAKPIPPQNILDMFRS
jgi:hypothetical protein